jgi:hypothetical protein
MKQKEPPEMSIEKIEVMARKIALAMTLSFGDEDEPSFRCALAIFVGELLRHAGPEASCDWLKFVLATDVPLELCQNLQPRPDWRRPV